MHKLVRQAGGEISGIWYCPHSAEHKCNCRKPKSGMIIDILQRFNAEAEETWLVGDSLRDLQAIAHVGGKSALGETGKGLKTLENEENKLPEHTLVFDDLMAFAQFVIQDE